MKKTWLTIALGATFLATTMTATIAQADTYKVGTHPTFAPFEFSDLDGTIIGFDLDIINAIAKVNGDKITIESMPFDGLIPSILTGNLDIIISGMTITEARKKRVEFSDGYYDSNLSIIIKKNKADTYTSADALKGKQICVQIGTTGHAFANVISPDNIKALNNEPDAILELNNGGCEAVINDRPVNLYYLKKAGLDSLIDFVDPKFKESVDKFGIAVRKGNTDLINKINKGLAQLKESGELDQIHLKWFGTNADGSIPKTADSKETATAEAQTNVAAESEAVTQEAKDIK